MTIGEIVAPGATLRSTADAGAACFHCGLPIPLGIDYHLVVDGKPRGMCCAGCQAVAQVIVANGLTSYYQHRSALPRRDQTVPAFARDSERCAVAGVEGTMTRDRGENQREAALLLEGITCSACVWLIEQRIAHLPGVLGMEINYATHRARVRWDARHTRLTSILEAVAALGYGAQPYASERAEQAAQTERKQALWRLFVAGFGMMQVMMYLLPVYVTNGEMTADVEQLMRIASLLLTLPVVAFSAAPLFAGAWRDLRARHLGMDVPVALGIGAAFAASLVATVSGGGQVYFDSITMFVFLLLAARYFEMSARTRALMARERLTQQLPPVAERLAAWPDSGLAELVAAGSLQVGDHVRIRPGSVVPADGEVVDGSSEMDERLLTGEARPLPRHRGDALTGGSFNVGNPLVMRVTQVGADTVLSGILRLLDRAAADRPRIALSAERVARHFVFVLLVIAALTAAGWYVIDPARALWVTVAVLVVSCPCALSLATPAALAAAMGSLQTRGVLITRGDALEALARATDFVFDKTGTLTTGRMQLATVMMLGSPAIRRTREDCLRLAAAIEASSSHPVARAIAAAAPAGTLPACSEVTHVMGEGIDAVVAGVHVRVGAPRFVAALHRLPLPAELEMLAGEESVVALGDAHGWIALFSFSDKLRSHARGVVRELVRMGKRVHLVSGDREPVVRHIARELGIGTLLGGASPRDKLDYVGQLQRNGAVVAMVGDGINDVAGLARAQVSIAMGGGADIACGNSDVLLLSGELDALITAEKIARKTLRVIRQNLAWAFAYNLAAVPLAALGYVTPLMAGIGMAGSSMLVVANALRLVRSPQGFRVH